MATNSEKVTIIIPTHDDLPYLQLLLESIRWFTHQPYELLIIADKPSNAIVEFLKGKPFIQVDFGDLYLTWNYGLKKAQTDKVCFLTADCVVSPYWLPKLARYSTDSNIVTCWTIDATNSFWGNRRMYYPCGSTPHEFQWLKFLQKVEEISREYEGQTDDVGWFVPWLVDRAFCISLGGWCTEERHPASMDEKTYQLLKAMRIPFIRALDAGIYHF